MLLDPTKADDIEICERRLHPRAMIDIPGRYSLADHWDASGKPRKFSCSAVNISRNAIALAAPVIGKVGKWVVAHISGLGRIEGVIVRVHSGGFAMSIAAREEKRLELLARIGRLERNASPAGRDRRVHSRFVPIVPCATLVLADGTARDCLVIDLSEAGAQIAAGVDSAIGTVLAVGTLVGRVVRRLPGGFAVKFVDLQSQDTVEARALANDRVAGMQLLRR
jgi:hypothetical protein